MNAYRFARAARSTIHLLAAMTMLSLAHRASAQSARATIPIVVAQASFLQFGYNPFGPPTYFDGRTPPDWPAALLPPGATVVGSAVVGDTGMFRMRTVVFEFPARSDARGTIETMLTLAGYGPPKAAAEQSAEGGFMQTAPAPVAAAKLCNGSTLAVFAAVDSTHAPHLFALDLLDGQAGRESCSPQRNPANVRSFPVTVPPLVAPAGTMSIGGSGSSWSGSSGTERSSLRTTMPVDSILANYTTQLVAGGWKAEGRGVVADGVGVQRFTFHEGQDAWNGALIIMAVGDRREIRLELSRID